MPNFRFFLLFFSLCCSVSINTAEAATQATIFRNFWHPTYLGERLGYCTLNGKECGQPVADHYCRMLGYHYSSQNEIAYNVGLTHFIAARYQCKGWRCNGFAVIKCAKRLSHIPPQTYHYREKEFVDPRFNDYRVDWCYKSHKNCGLQAANSFCSHIGFLHAKSFIKEKQVSATKTMGSQELCFGSRCNGFKKITCYR